MRGRAEGALRQVLTAAGQQCGFTASVVSNGVYTPLEVKRLIQQFEDGQISFSEITDIHFEKSDRYEADVRRTL